MFEDIVGAKFKGVDIGTRDIASEVKAQLMKGFKFGLDELVMDDEEEEKEFTDVLDEYMNENLDLMAQMYIDEFSTDDILEMLDFEMTPLAEKKIKFQLRMQKFIVEGFTKKLTEDDGFFDKTLNKGLSNPFDVLGADDNYESVVWDAKE